jgi:hypothetical protein
MIVQLPGRLGADNAPGHRTGRSTVEVAWAGRALRSRQISAALVVRSATEPARWSAPPFCALSA